MISCSDNNKSIDSDKKVYPSLQGNNYYLLSMDNISKSKINDKIAQDYRPDKINRNILIWSDSYSTNLCTDNNFYDEFQGWPSFTVGSNGWSAVAFNSSTGSNGFNFTKLDDSYTFHMLDERSFAFYNTEFQRFVVEPDVFNILVGSSSASILLQSQVSF